MNQNLLYSIAAALGLIITHIFAGKLRFLQVLPRSRWLSGAGGVSVAYVFIHIFPELNEGQKTFTQNTPPSLSFIEHHVYLLALLGFTFFYMLERFVKKYGSHKPSAQKEPQHRLSVFWVHIASFSIYNFLIGYLLNHREEQTIQSLIFYFIALALHFTVNDFGLRQHHHQRYDHTGRWVLAGAIAFGWLVGMVVDVDIHVVTTLFAFLAGSIVLNSMKEELPEDRESSPWAFLCGVTFYALLLLASQ